MKNSIYETEEFRRIKNEVINAYPGEGWRWRVNHMRKNQILAIYFDIKNRRKKKKETYKQITLFDICPEAMMVGGNT